MGSGPVECGAVGEDLGGLVFEACICIGFLREGHFGVYLERAVDAFCVGVSRDLGREGEVRDHTLADNRFGAEKRTHGYQSNCRGGDDDTLDCGEVLRGVEEGCRSLHGGLEIVLLEVAASTTG